VMVIKAFFSKGIRKNPDDALLLFLNLKRSCFETYLFIFLDSQVKNGLFEYCSAGKSKKGIKILKSCPQMYWW